MSFKILGRLKTKWANISPAIKYGVVANTGFSMFLRVSADSAQQNFEKKKIIKPDEYNLQRTQNIATIGVILGPIVYYWYKALDTLLPGKTFPIICKKILLDQIIGGVALTFIFITGLCLLDGQGLTSSLKEFREKFPIIYLVSWKISQSLRLWKCFKTSYIIRMEKGRLVSVATNAIFELLFGAGTLSRFVCEYRIVLLECVFVIH
jgi:hypothetical protein